MEYPRFHSYFRDIQILKTCVLSQKEKISVKPKGLIYHILDFVNVSKTFLKTSSLNMSKRYPCF